jgi:hypothetical protein
MRTAGAHNLLLFSSEWTKVQIAVVSSQKLNRYGVALFRDPQKCESAPISAAGILQSHPDNSPQDGYVPLMLQKWLFDCFLEISTRIQDFPINPACRIHITGVVQSAAFVNLGRQFINPNHSAGS